MQYVIRGEIRTLGGATRGFFFSGVTIIRLPIGIRGEQPILNRLSTIFDFSLFRTTTPILSSGRYSGINHPNPFMKQ